MTVVSNFILCEMAEAGLDVIQSGGRREKVSVLALSWVYR